MTNYRCYDLEAGTADKILLRRKKLNSLELVLQSGWKRDGKKIVLKGGGERLGNGYAVIIGTMFTIAKHAPSQAYAFFLVALEDQTRQVSAVEKKMQ